MYVRPGTSWKTGCCFFAVSCSVISAARWSGLAALSHTGEPGDGLEDSPARWVGHETPSAGKQ